MNNPGWEKAPLDATHRNNRTGLFYKIEGKSAFYFYIKSWFPSYHNQILLGCKFLFTKKPKPAVLAEQLILWANVAFGLLFSLVVMS